MSFQNEDQITKYQNSNIVLEFNDHMFPAPVESAANLHAGYSKIFIVGVDTTNGKGKDAVVAEANVDPIKMKCLFDKVKDIKSIRPVQSSEIEELTLGIGKYKNNTPTEALLKDKDSAQKDLEGLIDILEKNADKYVINKKKISQIQAAIKAFQEGTLKAKESSFSNQQSIILLSEKKINPSEKKKNENDEYPVTILMMEYNPRMRNPFIVSMENGWAKKEIQRNGGSSIKSGSYRKEKEIKKIVIDDIKFREIVRTINDYIINKELTFMVDLKERVIKFKEAKREKKD